MYNMETIKTYDQFRELIAKNKYVMINFCAEWRDPFHIMQPVLEKLCSHNAGRIVIAKIGISSLPESVLQFEALGVPDLCLFETGIAVEKLSGIYALNTLQEKLNKLISQRFTNICPRGH